VFNDTLSRTTTVTTAETMVAKTWGHLHIPFQKAFTSPDGTGAIIHEYPGLCSPFFCWGIFPSILVGLGDHCIWKGHSQNGKLDLDLLFIAIGAPLGNIEGGRQGLDLTVNVLYMVHGRSVGHAFVCT
jgi:hypothetical protein